jgi:hypothetical protein
MIKTVDAMVEALKRGRFAGVVLYEGPSRLDGKPIAVIANRITTKSNNDKTGAMVQTFIVRSDVNPVEALRSGDDASVCGDCKRRPSVAKAAGIKPCYVKVFQSVLSTWKALGRGRYARPIVDYDPRILSDLFEGKAFRMGSYGDPAAAPFAMWARATKRAAMVNGYSHQWHKPEFAKFKALTMASADNEAEALQAWGAGWRTFRVRAKDEARLSNEAICPASKEAGAKVSCTDCKACGGHSAKVRKSIVIMAH